MQVTDVQDHVTHAVIGANAARSFGISDSPEFFNILSNTLYSDKPLAVGRETLCNAWDAHIASGRTDKPVEIFLDQEELVIRDFGTGIPKDMMHPIYCIYGASTKTNNGKETGGFGLGCKAPFAYTDHFEVTSWCEGLKTIYRISKSSGEIGGKPGLMEILSIPTQETGLQVKIELKSPHDSARFEEIIRRIVLAGEMNVTLNGLKLPTLPFSEAPEGYILTREDVVSARTYGSIYVRYGSVIYPVTSHEHYSDEFEAARKLVSRLPDGASSWRLILQAEPNTITVTPSRETLEMGEKTVATIKALLERFNKNKTSQFKVEIPKIAAEAIQTVFMNMKPVQALSTNRSIIGLSSNSVAKRTQVTNFREISRLVAASSYPDDKEFRRKDMTLRLRSLIQSNFGNRGKAQTFLKAYRKEKYRPRWGYKSDWFRREIVGPLIMDLRANKLMSDERLLVYGHGSQPGIRRSRQWPYKEDMVYRAIKFEKEVLEDYMPFLRNIVILAFNRDDIEERARQMPETKFWFGDPRDSLVYLVQRSDPRVEEARKFFKERGFYLLDLTIRHKHEPEEAAAPRIVREHKPRKKGVPILSSVIDPKLNYVQVHLSDGPNVVRVEQPTFVITATGKGEGCQLDIFNTEASIAVARLFGAHGGIVVNKAQKTKYMAMGAADGVSWILDRVLAELKDNDRIQQYMARDWKRVADSEGWVKLICEDPVLQVYYDVAPNLTDDDKDYLRIWEFFTSHFRYDGRQDVNEMEKLLKSVPVSSNLFEVSRAARTSPLLDCMSRLTVQGRLKDKNHPEQTKAKIRDMIIFALKG